MLLIGVAGAATASAPVVSYTRTANINGPDGSWDYASIDPALHRLYVARSDAVTMVNLRDGSVTSIGTIARGHAAVPLPGGRLAVTSGNDATVRFLDAATGKQIGSVAVGTKPDAAIKDASGTHLLVMNAAGGSVSVIDVASMRVSSTIAVKPGLEYAAVVGSTLFINDEDANELEVVDLTHGSMSAAIPLTGCEGPTGLAYDSRHAILISACANGKAAVVDAKTRQLVRLVDISKGPDAVMIDAVRRVALIPCGRDGVLDVLALDAPDGVSRVSRIDTEVGARTGALDPATGIVYLPTAKYAQPATPGGRPVIVPGSFHIVVLRPGS